MTASGPGNPQPSSSSLDVRIVLGFAPRIQIDDDDTLGDRDLSRGEADAARLVHGVEHVGDERLDAVIEGNDRPRNFSERWVGPNDDFTYAHGADIDHGPRRVGKPVLTVLSGQLEGR